MAKDLNFQKIYALHRYLKKAKMAHVRLPAHCVVTFCHTFHLILDKLPLKSITALCPLPLLLLLPDPNFLCCFGLMLPPGREITNN